MLIPVEDRRDTAAGIAARRCSENGTGSEQDVRCLSHFQSFMSDCVGLPASPRCIIATWSLLSLLCLAGCGYTVGSGFPAEVRTIHVPVFESQSFRRGIEFQLTEAVQKELQKRTHFRLTPRPYADTELTGRIIDMHKVPLGESAFDDPRELQLSLFLEATWKDLRSGRILAQQKFPLDPATVQLVAQAEYAPEVGQSLATALQQSVDRLARRVVDMMETPW